MRRIAPHQVGVAQGSRLMFSDFADGGQMWTGSGPREARHRVTFDEPFLALPSVIVGISMWDADRQTNLRADVRAENIARDAFDLVMRTWGDSRLARARCDWTAIGPVQDDEVWVLD